MSDIDDTLDVMRLIFDPRPITGERGMLIFSEKTDGQMKGVYI